MAFIDRSEKGILSKRNSIILAAIVLLAVAAGGGRLWYNHVRKQAEETAVKQRDYSKVSDVDLNADQAEARLKELYGDAGGTPDTSKVTYEDALRQATLLEKADQSEKALEVVKLTEKSYADQTKDEDFYRLMYGTALSAGDKETALHALEQIKELIRASGDPEDMKEVKIRRIDREIAELDGRGQ